MKHTAKYSAKHLEKYSAKNRIWKMGFCKPLGSLTQKLSRKLSQRNGFSLGELLAATIILLLASQVLAQGMAFATRMYNETLTDSHARQLCSTLTNAIETELRYTTSIRTDRTTETGKLISYFSPTYGETSSSFCALDKEGNPVADSAEGGELAIQVIRNQETKEKVWQRLISSASYSSYQLKANVSAAVYNADAGLFHITLSITDKNDKNLVTSEFDVIPVNKLN